MLNGSWTLTRMISKNPLRLLLLLTRAYPKGTAAGIGVFACLMLFLGLREASHILVKERPKVVIDCDSGILRLYNFESKFGQELRPNATVRDTGYYGNAYVYDVLVHTDEYGRRLTPVPDAEKRDKFLIFLGCSFTFGEGVEDDQTLPFFTGLFAPRYMPYNYGCNGYGPQHMLLKLQEEEFSKEIRQRSGIAVYVYIDDHRMRAIGYHDWNQHDPCFVPEGDGVKYCGPVWTAQPLRSWLYPRMEKSRMLRFLHLSCPRWISNRAVDITEAIIKASAQRFHTLYPEATFCVIRYGTRSRETPDPVMPRLRDAGILCLDYASLPYDPSLHGDRFSVDGHPTALRHKEVGRQLAQDLKITGDR